MMNTPDRPAVDALYIALTSVAPEIVLLSAAERASLLKSSVFAAVDELKRMGLSSPRIESILLSFLAEACPLWAKGQVADDVRAWCIQRYYDPTV